jgi:hypothetical protein
MAEPYSMMPWRQEQEFIGEVAIIVLYLLVTAQGGKSKLAHLFPRPWLLASV